MIRSRGWWNGGFRVVLAMLLLCSLHGDATGAEPMDVAVRQKAERAIDRGLAFLAARQRADGGWESFGKTDPAITALVVKGFLQHSPSGAGHLVAQRGLAFVTRFAHEDGGIYVEGIGLRNYYTSVALMTLAATGDASYQDTIRNAQAFLVKRQWDEGEDYEPVHVWYGGAGYGQHKRPDLSNTQMMLEALHQSGLPADHPAYRKAMVFVQRCQMSSGSNDQPFAAAAHDGGFIYTCANDGESQAGTVMVNGQPQLRSYGSMTYAGFKSMLYAKVDRKDGRVQAAYDWIREHYTLDANPNMPDPQSREGLYYYYHVFARALYAWGDSHIVDAKGQRHNWREDLCHALLERQRQDGSWVNEADRWYEGNPDLVTAYAVLALQTALRPTSGSGAR